MAHIEACASLPSIRTPPFPALNTEFDVFAPSGGFLSALDSPDTVTVPVVSPIDYENSKVYSEIDPSARTFFDTATGSCLSDATLFTDAAIDSTEGAAALVMAGENEISQTDLDNMAQWIVPRLAGGGGGPGQSPIADTGAAAELSQLDTKQQFSQFLLEQQMHAAAGVGGSGSTFFRDEEVELYSALLQQQIRGAQANTGLQDLHEISRMAETSNAAYAENWRGGAPMGSALAAAGATVDPRPSASQLIPNASSAGDSALAIRPSPVTSPAMAQSTAQFSRAATQLAAGSASAGQQAEQWPPQRPAQNHAAGVSAASAGQQLPPPLALNAHDRWLQNQPPRQQQQHQQQLPPMGGPSAGELDALFQQIPPSLAPEERIVLAAALMAEVQRNTAALGASGYSTAAPSATRPSPLASSRGAAEANPRQPPIFGRSAGSNMATGNQPPTFMAQQELLGSQQQQPAGSLRFIPPAANSGSASLRAGFPEFPTDLQDIAQCMSGEPFGSEAFDASESSAERVAGSASAPGEAGVAAGSRGGARGGGGGGGGNGGGASGASQGGGGASRGGASDALKAIRPRSVKERRRRERISDCLRRLKLAIPQDILGDRQDLGSMIEKSVSYIHTLQTRLDSLEATTSKSNEEDVEEAE